MVGTGGNWRLSFHWMTFDFLLPQSQDITGRALALNIVRPMRYFCRALPTPLFPSLKPLIRSLAVAQLLSQIAFFEMLLCATQWPRSNWNWQQIGTMFHRTTGQIWFAARTLRCLWHLFRKGGATAAAQARIHDSALQRHGRWKPIFFMRYACLERQEAESIISKNIQIHQTIVDRRRFKK